MMKANEDARLHGHRAQIDRAVSAIIAGRREATIDDIFTAAGGAAVAFAVAQRAVKFPGLADALDRRGLLAAWSGRYGLGHVAATETRSTRVARLVEAMRREHAVEVG